MVRVLAEEIFINLSRFFHKSLLVYQWGELIAVFLMVITEPKELKSDISSLYQSTGKNSSWGSLTLALFEAVIVITSINFYHR